MNNWLHFGCWCVLGDADDDAVLNDANGQMWNDEEWANVNEEKKKKKNKIYPLYEQEQGY